MIENLFDNAALTKTRELLTVLSQVKIGNSLNMCWLRAAPSLPMHNHNHWRNIKNQTASTAGNWVDTVTIQRKNEAFSLKKKDWRAWDHIAEEIRHSLKSVRYV